MPQFPRDLSSRLLTVNLEVPLVLHDGVVQRRVLGAAGQVAAVVLDRRREPQHALRHAAVARLKQANKFKFPAFSGKRHLGIRPPRRPQILLNDSRR